MNSQRGTSLIEVLVTMVILAFGLLGAAGLQARLQLADMESYQRAQALVLMDDIASRIATNRAHAVDHAPYLRPRSPSNSPIPYNGVMPC